jgi:hypothetical protein
LALVQANLPRQSKCCRVALFFYPVPEGLFSSVLLHFKGVVATNGTPFQYMFLCFGGLGGNNGKQSWLKDVLVSFSTPGHTHHMLLGAAGPLIAGVATYGPRKMLSCAILAVVSALCQVMNVHVMLQWPLRW